MRLKKLEIYGFKSFADRVTMTFADGITGVVGPNGSGKSNIGDAVRWVLGEQSAKTLRGGKMEDVIFGGSEKRRPQGYCEVSLTFDNTDGTLPIDYSEVMITRRVYRSGESEYFINKTGCRLRDIVDLMRDTGIGREGYSLVGQGRIDEILSVKSEERRSVFEEAAGISKFKARKTEAERRLDNTTQNMERVEDILTEVGAKLPSLEKQAGNAREYMKLTGELRGLEISSFCVNFDRLTQQQENAEAQMRQLLSQEEKNLAQREAITSESREKEEGILLSDGKIAALHEKILEKTREAEVLEGDLNLHKERISTAKKEIARLREENRAATLSGAELQEKISENRNKQADLLHKIGNLSKENAAMEEKANVAAQEVARKEEALERGKEAMIRSLNALSDVRSAAARMTATKEAIEKQIAGVTPALQQAGEALRKAESEEVLAAEALKAEQETLSKVKERRAQAAARFSALQAENQQLTGTLQRALGAQREAQSRLKMLEQMQRDYEGYGGAVKEVLRRFSGNAGLHGVVADIISVPKEYEKAVEMALGGAMQDIVCSREEDAKAMIDYLRQNRYGRATFLPMTSVRGRVLGAFERQVLSMDGCLGLASELVSFDPKYKEIVENLLGRTVIAHDLNAGIAIMRAGKHAFRLVTLEGDVMHSGGSMTGGSTAARTTSILSRTREIEEHRAAVKTLNDKVSEIQARFESIKKDIADAQRNVDAAGNEVHQQDIAVLREQEKLGRAREKVSEAKENQDYLTSQKEQMETSIAQIEEELAAMSEKTGAAETTSATSQEDIAKGAQEVALLRRDLEDLREKLSAGRADEGVKQAELEALLREEKRLNESGQEAQNAIAIRKRAEESLTQRLSEDENAVPELEARIAQSRESVSQENLTLQKENDERERLRTRISKLSEELEELQETMTAAAEDRHRLEMLQNRTANELKTLLDRIWERYELTPETARPFALPDYQESVSRSRIDQLNRAIRALGPVNVAALDEYEEQKTRYDEMSRQRDDLNKAKVDLEKIISDLEKNMEVRFSEEFQKINEHFQRTFNRMFGGGTAKLQLQDEKDVLNCGIDIIAQPPGKKLQLLSLLSGGERALTAIAILFAMLEIRPSPFCILDEIEAALDESNVVNFAEYLKEYSEKTQFIVISHRKGTMERCDSLYGVAMEEKGVSRMVSVALSELDKHLEENRNE